MRRSLLKALQVELREYCSDHLNGHAIDDAFTNADFTSTSDVEAGGVKRSLVEGYYQSADWELEETLQRFLRVIGYVLQYPYTDRDAKEKLRLSCRDFGLHVGEDDYRVSLNGDAGWGESFARQFPAGLPFGIPKPNFSIRPEGGGQTLNFELKSGLGIIESNVYPDFSFKALEASYGLDPSTNAPLRKALWKMNSTETEEMFFVSYAKKYKMVDRRVPVLIPQAWIQWHSLAKRNLREISSAHIDDLYRVDFVAFWRNIRYAILIDDIGHYAKRRGARWDADEESYSKRLKEDRKLQKEDWRVFRISNWEVRNAGALNDALVDLRVLMGFDETGA